MKLFVPGTSQPLRGELVIPRSKYHAHRALVLASLAPGTSVVHGLSDTRQTSWTIGVLRALGTRIEVHHDATGGSYVVHGGPYRAAPVQDHGSSGADGLLNVGSSGTTLYFMVGLAALADAPMTLTGMKYFRRRPIRALLESLRQMGLRLDADEDRPPITVTPGRPSGGHVEIAGTLSQWLSGLLLVAPFATRDTTIDVTGGALNEQPYVDLTLRMMADFGLTVHHSDDWLHYEIPAGQTAVPTEYTLPPDIGSAAFGLAVTALHPSDVLFRGLSTTRTADTDHPEAEFLDLAGDMGLPMTIDEETGFVRVRHDGLRLKPLDIDCRPIPDLLPALTTMAAFADGTTVLRHLDHIRLKESDRVTAMLQLGQMGADLREVDGTLRVTGVTGELEAARLSSFNDHRVLMALAVAATRARGESSLTYPHAYRISYPAFLQAMDSIGLSMAVDDPRNRRTAHPVPQGVDAEPLVLTERVAELARTEPEATAVVEVRPEGNRTTSWAELQDRADKISALLLDLGVAPGEAVAFQLPNWTEFVAITLAALQIGAVATPVMPVFREREIAMVLARSKARVLFVPRFFRKRRHAEELLGVPGEAARQGRELHLEHVVVLPGAQPEGGAERGAGSPAELARRAHDVAGAEDWAWHAYPEAVSRAEPDRVALDARRPGPDDVAQLLFTSGTTGEPKGVQQIHRSLGLATAMEVAHLGLTSADRVYVPSPIAHQTGFLYGLLLSWRLGVAAVVQPVWNAETSLRRAFGEGRATFVQAATPFLMDLVDAVADRGAPVPESLRIFVATGAAVPRALAERATRVLGTAVCGAFGTTETCLATLSTPDDPPVEAWGTDGRALPGIDIRIVDDEGRPVAAGVEGDYELHSPTLFVGYLDRPDLTDEVFTADGWYRTGDLGVIDEQGFLHITGRVKDVINRGGEKIPVVEIENLLFEHPKVADVAIVAMPDERLGERACAFVVPAPGAEPLGFAELQHFLDGHDVSKYYWPERLEFVDRLPRNPIGKIQKNVLRERAAAIVAAERTEESK